jgi:hypothetical protein
MDIRHACVAMTVAAALAALAPTAASAGQCQSKAMKSEDTYKAIAEHAFEKHKGEFEKNKKIANMEYTGNTVTNVNDLEKIVDAMMNSQSPYKPFLINCPGNVRQFWHEDDQNILLIYNKGADDCGTIFRPTAGTHQYTADKAPCTMPY